MLKTSDLLRDIRATRPKVEAAMRRMRVHQGRLSRKRAGRDIAKELVERRLAMGAQELQSMAYGEQVAERALVLLADYDYIKPAPPMSVRSAAAYAPFYNGPSMFHWSGM